MSLRDEIKTLEGRKRRFVLLRIVDTDVETARKLCNIPKATYNSWFKKPTFVELYRKIPDWSAEYKQEAIQLLRRTTQLQAALLEEQIIQKMKEEIESGEYNLIKTLLARSVYDKVMNSLDYQPQALAMSWEQRLQNIYTNQPQITEGGQDATIIETTGEFKEQYQESISQQDSEQELEQASEEVQT